MATRPKKAKSTPSRPAPIVDFTEIAQDGEDWEAFAREFLVELGFVVESPPDRGPDGGKDLLVTERLSGALSSYPLRWLVSCKHFAHTKRAVSANDEPSILERMRSFRADGFMGFYSTLPSSALNNRLRALHDGQNIRDYKVFDRRGIENYLIRLGYSKLLMRFLPESYKRIKPLHQITDAYLPLACERCGKDLLQELYKQEYQGVIALARETLADGKQHVVDVYWACKGACDRSLQAEMRAQHGVVTAWEDISDLAMPAWYLRWMLGTTEDFRRGKVTYSDSAWKKERYFLLAMAQRTLREMTELERSRVGRLLELPQL